MRSITLALPLSLLAASAFAQSPGQQVPVSAVISDPYRALAHAAGRPPDAREALAAAHGRLRESLDRLRRFLRTGGTEAGWDKLLDLSGLQSELSRDEPDAEKLRTWADRFRQNLPGLELRQFLAVRQDLRGYLIARQYFAADQPQELYRQNVGELQDCLTRLDARFDEIDCHRAGTLVAWIAALSPEGAAAADAVRSHCGRVNAVGCASERAANLLLERRVEEQNYFTDMVLGAFTSGPTYAHGRVTVGVVPNQHRSTLEIRLDGQAAAPATVARQRNVAVYSSSQTSLRVQKRVDFDEQGLTFLPALAAAVTNMQLNDVTAPRRLVERLAWRRASRMVPEAQALASRRAESEASVRMNAQAAEMMGGINSLYRDQLRAPLVRIDAFPAARFSSSAGRARVELSQWNGSQLAPATAAPQFPPDYDLACGAHESMINNFAECLLAGATTQDAGWSHAVELMTGEVPRPLWIHDRAQRWTLTFAQERPFIAYFEDGQIAFRLRLTKVKRGEREIEHPIEVVVQLVPQISPRGQPFLTRPGEIEIEMASGLESNDEADLRKFLAAKLGAVFPPELYFDGFVAPSGGTIGRLRAMEAVEFRSENGWLTLGYKINAKTAETALAESNSPVSPTKTR